MKTDATFVVKPMKPEPTAEFREHAVVMNPRGVEDAVSHPELMVLVFVRTLERRKRSFAWVD
jgi:hypothetical protein